MNNILQIIIQFKTHNMIRLVYLEVLLAFDAKCSSQGLVEFGNSGTWIVFEDEIHKKIILNKVTHRLLI